MVVQVPAVESEDAIVLDLLEQLLLDLELLDNSLDDPVGPARIGHALVELRLLRRRLGQLARARGLLAQSPQAARQRHDLLALVQHAREVPELTLVPPARALPERLELLVHDTTIDRHDIASGKRRARRSSSGSR